MKLNLCLAALVAAQTASFSEAQCTDPCWAFSGPFNSATKDNCEKDAGGYQGKRWFQTPSGSWKKCKYSSSEYYADVRRSGNNCYSDGYHMGDYPTTCPVPPPTNAPAVPPLSRSEEIDLIGGLPNVSLSML